MLDTIIGKARPVIGDGHYLKQFITRLPEYKIATLGICRKFRGPGALDGLSVREKLLVAYKRSKAGMLAALRATSPRCGPTLR